MPVIPEFQGLKLPGLQMRPPPALPKEKKSKSKKEAGRRGGVDSYVHIFRQHLQNTAQLNKQNKEGKTLSGKKVSLERKIAIFSKLLLWTGKISAWPGKY